jgi:hypothetical protein
MGAEKVPETGAEKALGRAVEMRKGWMPGRRT